MSQATAIEWTDLSWNPVHGCSIVSTECRNCYAMTRSLRYRQTLKPWTPANAAENVLLKPHKLREPLSNTKPWRGLGAAAAAAGKTDGKLVFVNSMSDLFHEQVPNEFIAAVFGVMAAAEQHTFQILTKRPERMLEWFAWYEAQARDRELLGVDPSSGLCDMPADVGFQEARGLGVELGEAHGIPWPLPNVWLGTSVGLRHFTGRVDHLRETPAAVRFISAEPLLGPLAERMHCGSCWDWPRDDCDECEGLEWWWSMESLDLLDIDWLIVGGESGQHLGQAPHRFLVDEQGRPREDRAHWVRDLRDLAEGSDTAFFFKQWGGRTPKAGGRELDGRTWDEMPNRAVAA